MRRKERIIRYLGKVERANRHDIAQAIGTTVELTSVYMTRLKHAGLVRNVEWPDGDKVWFLTEEGDRRWKYYVERDRQQRGD